MSLSAGVQHELRSAAAPNRTVGAVIPAAITSADTKGFNFIASPRSSPGPDAVLICSIAVSDYLVPREHCAVRLLAFYGAELRFKKYYLREWALSIGVDGKVRPGLRARCAKAKQWD